MHSFYESFLSGTELWQNDNYNFLSNYFNAGGAATTSFLIAIIVAIVGLAIFYGIFGMKFPKVGSNRIVWLVIWVAVFGVTYLATDFFVIGDANNVTGIFDSMNTQVSELKNGAHVESIKVGYDTAYHAMVYQLSSGCGFNLTLLLVNSAIAFVVYGLGSLGVKRLTKYSINVPF